jgi:hypothetical protein
MRTTLHGHQLQLITTCHFKIQTLIPSPKFSTKDKIKRYTLKKIIIIKKYITNKINKEFNKSVITYFIQN